jgi:hypothetical protein
MSEHMFTCPLCGHRFDPRQHLACGGCPVNKDCSMVCCPACGYSTVDASQSKLANWIASLGKKDKTREQA